MNSSLRSLCIPQENFKIDESGEIGRGAFGVVYRAVYLQDKDTIPKQYALKEVPVNSNSPTSVFLREVMTLSNMRFPTILQIAAFNINEKSRIPTDQSIHNYIATEYMQNGSLQTILDLENLSCAPQEWNETKKSCAIVGIAFGMAYVHSKGVLHRDIKPGNILLDNNFYIRIADFGLAKALSTMQTCVGTPMYEAPEAMTNPYYSFPVDVYSFGIMLFSILSSKTPYVEEDLPIFDRTTLMRHVSDGGRPTITQEMRDSNNYLCELMTKCWSQDPLNRPKFYQIAKDIIKNRELFMILGCDDEEFDNYVDFLIEKSDIKQFKRGMMKAEEGHKPKRGASRNLINFD